MRPHWRTLRAEQWWQRRRIGSTDPLERGGRRVPMIVGVPKEVKDRENRVSTTPAGVAEFVARGHQVVVERKAGTGSGFADAEYETAGGALVDTHAEVFSCAEMIVKVKEPGAHYLERTQGGRGMLLGGVPGVPGANVVVIGGGVVGTNAAQVALGMGANVTIVDKNVERLRQLDLMLHGRSHTLASNQRNIAEAVRDADLVIGGVLIAGAKAPKLVTRQMVASMRSGSVVVDVAIDQGGCIETARPTSHSEPTYLVDDVIHYCVTNMPGAVPRTSTLALSNVTLPYALEVADLGLERAAGEDPALAGGINVLNGVITYEAVAEAFGLPFQSWQSVA
jgi:alanine dehydrogenase